MRISTQAGLALAAAMLAACIAPAAANVVKPSGATTAPHVAASYFRLPSLLSPQERAKLAKRLEHYKRPNLPSVRHDAASNIWLSDYGASYLWETDAKTGKKIVGQINMQNNGCFGNNGIVVDHNRNLWVACATLGSVYSPVGGIQEYAPGATSPTLTLNYSGPSGGVAAQPGDVAVDAAGDVFATNLEYQFGCTPSCNGYYITSYTYWKAGTYSPSGSNVQSGTTDDTLADAGNSFSPQSLDVSANGNDLYLAWYGQQFTFSSYSQFGGVDDISNPMAASPTMTNLIGNGGSGPAVLFPGGVQVTTSGGHSYLSVQDGGYGYQNNVLVTGANKLYQFQLPFTGSPIDALTSPQNIANGCVPIGIGFNKKATRVAAADAYCHADMLGTVAHNTWTAATSINFVTPEFAQFSPSNK
jgi:hypothetical protein